VVAHRGGATRRINAQGDGVTHLEGRRSANRMHGECADWTLRIADLSEQLSTRIKGLSCIAHLSAALGVERGAPNNQLALLAGR
jgi:hypothetical protein